jgi:hypothetical protein
MRPYSLRNLPNTRDRTGTALCSAGLKGWHALYCRVSWSDVPKVDVSDTHRLKSLEDENAKLKRLLADTMLDNVVLKDLLEKNLRHRTCDGLQHARQCAIMISHNAERAGWSVSIPRPSGAMSRPAARQSKRSFGEREIIQRFAKR